MTEIVITYVGAMPHHDGQPHAADIHPFTPCLQAARVEEVILKVWVQVSGFGATIAIRQIEGLGGVEDGSDAVLDQLLIRYGVRRLEAVVKDLVSRNGEPDDVAAVWQLTEENVPELLALWPLATEKVCEYQQRVRRDLFCLTPSPRDETAIYSIDGRPAAPTSRAVCKECDLPDTDVMCSNLLHPQITGISTMGGLMGRQVAGVVCDLGKPEVQEVNSCRAGGHKCWQRAVEVQAPKLEELSPLSLPESFDVLDALWRLAFGKSKRLLALTTVSGPATLTLGCSSRVEFESRLSALADVIDKFHIDAGLLPTTLSGEEIKGSLDALEKCLLHQLSPEQHPAITGAVRTLRDVRQARNAIQHGVTHGGGLTAKLRDLGVHNAPPNWSAAWDAVRIQTSNALTTLRHELRQWIDASP